MKCGFAILRMLTHRYRWMYPAMVAYLVGLAGLAQAFGEKLPAYAFFLTLPYFIGLLITTAAFVNPETDLAGEASGYPPYLLRMPVRTEALALWPMVGGTVWAGGMYAALAKFFFHPVDIQFGIASGVLICALAVLTFQALIWMPVRSGKFRMLISILIPVGILFGNSFLLTTRMEHSNILTICGAEALLAGIFAAYAVVKARTIGTVRNTQERKSRIRLDRRQKAAFASPYEAQFWLEWHRQGRILPIFTGLTLGVFSVPLLWERNDHHVWVEGDLLVNPWAYTMLMMIPWIPLLFATVIGAGARQSDLRNEEGQYHLFYATRPLSGEEMIRAKYAALTKGVAMAWGVTLLVGFVWLCMPANAATYASDFDRYRPVGAARPLWWFLAERYGASRIAAGAGILLLLMIWSWRNQLVGAFADYVPDKNIGRTYPMAVLFIGGTLFTVVMTNPSITRDAASTWYIAAILAVVVGYKLWLARTLLNRLVQARPSEQHYADAVRRLWPCYAAAAAAILYFLLGYLTRDMPTVPGILSAPVAILGGIALTPLTRPIGARLALEFGRHRK